MKPTLNIWSTLAALLLLTASACTGLTNLSAAAETATVAVSGDPGIATESASRVNTTATQSQSQQATLLETLLPSSAIPATTPAAPAPEANTEAQPVPASIGDYLGADLSALYSLKSQDTPISLAVFSPDGQFLATLSGDNHIQLWLADNGSLIGDLGEQGAPVLDLDFSADGLFIAIGREDNIVQIWSLEDQRLAMAIDTSLIGRAVAVAFSPDGGQIAVGGHKCAVALYNTWSGLLTRTFYQPGCSPKNGGSVAYWGLIFSPDGSTLLTADGQAGSGGSIQRWQVEVYTAPQTVASFSSGVRDLAYSPDSEMLVVALIGSSIAQVIQANTGQVLQTLVGHQHRINSVTFSPDGQLVATGSRDGTTRLWDTGTGYLLRTLTGQSGAVNNVAFSPDGALLLTSSEDGTAIGWALQTPETS